LLPSYRPSLQNFSKFFLHLWKFPVISTLQNQLHFTHPSAKNAEGWGTRMESESLEEEAIEIGNS